MFNKEFMNPINVEYEDFDPIEECWYCQITLYLDTQVIIA